MKKLIFTICLSAIVGTTCNAQQVVFDPAVVSTLVVNHEVQNNNLKAIKENEGKIAGYQKAITLKMVQIKELEQKMYNGLKSVTAVIRDSKSIIYASDIAADVVKYQNEMIEIAQGNPELTIVALKTELQLINRTADLFTHIYTVAIIGTDFNLMNNKQRLDLVTHVVDELRVMRGLAYSITRKMRYARYAGLLKALNILNFNYNIDRDPVINEVLRKMKS